MVISNPRSDSFPPRLVKRQLVELVIISLVFGLMGRIPLRNKLCPCIGSAGLLGYSRAVEFVQYLAKDFFTMRFNDHATFTKILAEGPLFFDRDPICVLSWDPNFSSASSVKDLCPIWVEFVNLPV